MNNCSCGQQMILSCYPYKSSGPMYMCDCCNHMHQPNTAQYPSGGKMQENAYMINNTMPFLVDNSTTSYGTKLSVSESVYTRVTKRKDPSCINLVAVLDMTDDIIPNTQYAAFLEQTISNHYNELNGVLPVMKCAVKFKFYFHVEDEGGGIVYENTATSIVKDHLFHYTDVNDYFLTSFRNVFVANIPAMDFQGIYNLIIDRVEAISENIDTNAHVIPGDINPFYAFTNNNTKVFVNSEEINATPADTSDVIASIEVGYGMPVQLGLTTRLKVAFTAFLNNTIAIGNSFGVYNALMGTTERSIEELTEKIEELEARIETIEEELPTIRPQVVQYMVNKQYTTGMLVWNTLGDLYQVANNFTSSTFNADTYNGNLVKICAYDDTGMSRVTKFKDYLYTVDYSNIDYDYAMYYLKRNNVDLGGACTSVYAKGTSEAGDGNSFSLFGRNFDWYYSNSAYFVTRISKGKDVKYQSLNVCGGISELSADFVDSGVYDYKYKILPFLALDGINEKGVVASLNVVPSGDFGVTTGTTPTVEKLHEISAIVLVRFVLDRFATAAAAVDYIEKYVSVYAPKFANGEVQELHAMICDVDDAYLVEFINNETVITKMTESDSIYTYMTNFYLNGVSYDEDGHVDYESVTPYGNGLERYDILTDNIADVSNVESMTELMDKVRFTKAYDFETNGWKTELASRKTGLKITDPVEAFADIIATAEEAFENRTRENPITWQTCHSSVYNLTDNSLHLIVQEEGIENQITFEFKSPCKTVSDITEGAIKYDYGIKLKKQQIVSYIMEGAESVEAALFIVGEDYTTEETGDIEELIFADIAARKLIQIASF